MNLYSSAIRFSLRNMLSTNIKNRFLQIMVYHPTAVCHFTLCTNNIYIQQENINKIGFDKVKLSPFTQPVRLYAKSKDKQKSSKGQKKKVHVSEEVLNDVINNSLMKDQMASCIDKMKDEFIKNLSLRSTSGSIESLPITFEGNDYILQDLAQVVRKNPKTVVIQMAAFPQAIPTVLQAISKSGMNLSPQQDGTTLYIPIPKVTKEHREMLTKNAKALFIKCRDSVKDVQNKFIKMVKNKEKDGLSIDTSRLIAEYITVTAAEHISAAEKILEAKQHELIKEQ